MKLKASLLYMILENHPTSNKYSKAYINLKNVIKLERDEGFEFPENIIKTFQELTHKYSNFINEIPLPIVEKFYNEDRDDLKRYIFIEYKSHELNMRIIEIFNLLEEFYNEIFSLACEIASYYNIEIKLNENKNSSENDYL